VEENEELTEAEVIHSLFNNAQEKLLSTLNNKTVEEINYIGRTLIEWDIFFTIKVDPNASMSDMRTLMVITSNKLDECRNLLSSINGKYKNAKIKLSAINKKLHNIRLQYNARGTAINLKIVERQLEEEHLALEMANSFTEIIVERFKENLFKLLDKKKAIEVVLYNMQNELKNFV